MKQNILKAAKVIRSKNSGPYELTLEQFKFFTLAEMVLQSVVNLFGHLGLGLAGGIASLLVKKK